MKENRKGQELPAARTGREVYAFTMKGSDVMYVVNDWNEKNTQSNLRVRRYKDKHGFAIIETMDVMFAAYILQWYPEAEITVSQLETR